MKKILTLAFALILFAAAPARAFNNDGVEVEPLTFGQGIITDNTSVRSCTIPAGGTQTCDAQITLLKSGTSGIFQLSDYDPTVALWAYIDDSTTTLSNGGQIFDVKNFTFSPDLHDIGTAAVPNADGTLLLYIGATLQTRAGVSYSNKVYRGTFTLQINY